MSVLPASSSWASPVARRVGWSIAFAIALLVLCASIGLTDVRRIGRRETGDFRHFYDAAAAVAHGQDPYAAGTRGYIYPPLIAFAFQPLVPLGRDRAAAVMLGVNVAVTLVAVGLLADHLLRRLGGPRGWPATLGVAFLGLLLDVDKVKGEWQMWQTDVFMVAAAVLALRWLDRRPILAGAVLGVAVNIKYLPIVLLPYLLIRRRVTVAAAMVVGTVGFGLLPAVSRGWAGDRHDWATAVRGLAQMAGGGDAGEAADVHGMSDALSCSIPSAIARGTRSPALGLAGAAAVAGLTFAVAGVMYRRARVPLLGANGPAMAAVEWPVLFAGLLAFGPQTNTRHLFDAVLVTTAAVVLLAFAGRRVSRVPLAVGVAVVVAGFVLPPGTRDGVGRASAVGWLRVGGPCGCLLVAAMTLLWTGLRAVSSSAQAAAATGSAVGSDRS